MQKLRAQLNPNHRFKVFNIYSKITLSVEVFFTQAALGIGSREFKFNNKQDIDLSMYVE